MEGSSLRGAASLAAAAGDASPVGAGAGAGAMRSFAKMGQVLAQALESTSTVFQVFVSEPVSLDVGVFELWVRGFREEQVVYYRRSQLGGGEEAPAAERELLLLLYRDVIDQYRLLQMIESFLMQPLLLERQLLAQMSPPVRTYLVAKYHEFDDNVVRELLGRKLTTRARKDLDELSETTGCMLLSCRRQFDNTRRIFNYLDERNFEGSITNLILEQFRLPWPLAERYTCIMFLLFNRFHVQTGRRKTGSIRLAELEYCAALMIAFWVSETSASQAQAQAQAQVQGAQQAAQLTPQQQEEEQQKQQQQQLLQQPPTLTHSQSGGSLEGGSEGTPDPAHAAASAAAMDDLHPVPPTILASPRASFHTLQQTPSQQQQPSLQPSSQLAAASTSPALPSSSGLGSSQQSLLSSSSSSMLPSSSNTSAYLSPQEAAAAARQRRFTGAQYFDLNWSERMLMGSILGAIAEPTSAASAASPLAGAGGSATPGAAPAAVAIGSEDDGEDEGEDEQNLVNDDPPPAIEDNDSPAASDEEEDNAEASQAQAAAAPSTPASPKVLVLHAPSVTAPHDSISRPVTERRRSSSVTSATLSRPPLLALQTPKPGNTSLELSPALIWKWRLIKNHLCGTRDVLDDTIRAVLNEISNELIALGGAAMKPVVRRLKLRYKTWVRSLLTIGSGLSQLKELRDFFEDVVVLLCEPLFHHVGLSPEHLEVLLRRTHKGFAKAIVIEKEDLRGEWDSYMLVMSLIIARLYVEAL
jgi:hypothetical protein